MSQAGSQAFAIYEEVVKKGAVWTVYDDGGYPVPKNLEGKRAQPFWSSLSRVEKIIKAVPAYSQFKPEEIPLEEFLEKHLESLAKNPLNVGVNWSGKKAIGYDLEPSFVKKAIQSQMQKKEAVVLEMKFD